MAAPGRNDVPRNAAVEQGRFVAAAQVMESQRLGIAADSGYSTNPDGLPAV